MYPKGTEVVRVPPVKVMEDQTLVKHLELRHGNDLSMQLLPAPDQEEFQFNTPELWRTYHNKLHQMRPHDYDHVHNEE